MEFLFVVLFLMLCSITAEGNSGRSISYSLIRLSTENMVVWAKMLDKKNLAI